MHVLYFLQLHHNGGLHNADGYTLLFNGGSNSKTTNSSTGLLPKATSPTNHGYGALETSGPITASLREHGVPMGKALTPLPESIAIQVCFYDRAFQPAAHGPHAVRETIKSGPLRNQSRIGPMSNWWIYEIKWMKISKLWHFDLIFRVSLLFLFSPPW